MAEPLKVTDSARFNEGQEAEEGPRRKRGEEEKGGATQNGCEATALTASRASTGACRTPTATIRRRSCAAGQGTGGQAQYGDDDELPENEGDQGVDQSTGRVFSQVS